MNILYRIKSKFSLSAYYKKNPVICVFIDMRFLPIHNFIRFQKFNVKFEF